MRAIEKRPGGKRRSGLTRFAVMGAVIGTVVVTLLAGCDGSSKSSGSSTSGSSASGSGAGGSSGPGSPTGYNAAATQVVNPSTKAGGTLNLVSTIDCDSWDPARTAYGWCDNLQRLFTRTLVGYSTVNGTKFSLAPDLATDLGKPNADDTQWTFTLKSGLKWSNGAAITPMDVKWGIERMFAGDVIDGGPTYYFTTLIDHPKDYAGPYKDGDLSTITTTADSITFKLTTPYADFPYLMAMTASAPVPYKTEGGPNATGANYGKAPVASGPFMISSYTPAQSITFVRNPNWTQASDTIRKPLVDKVVLTVDTNQSDVDAKLKSGQVDANASSAVGPTLQTQLLTDSSLKANADDPLSASTTYFAVMPSVVPNADCRKAIFYASDKSALLQAFGGSVSGTIAQSMTPPGIPGYDPSADVYGAAANPTGDLTKAKAALASCGKPGGFSIKMAYPTPSTHTTAAFTAEQTALARVGIKLTPAAQDGSTYFRSFVGSPANVASQGLGIAYASWGADFPTAYGFWNSIANGSSIEPTGNTNLPSLNDPAVNAVLDKAPRGGVSDADWSKMDTQIMNDAVYLPIYFTKNLYYRNPRLTNVTCDNALAFGIYDFVNVGVS
jgi:peptide/nickel transport system substrate-binding protein